MIQFFTRRIQRKSGFTLVEMIIVMAIMGILLTITIPRLGMYRRDADETVAIAEAAAVYTALSTYLARHGADEYRNSYLQDRNAIVTPYLTKQPNWSGGALASGEYVLEDVSISDSFGNVIAVYPGDDAGSPGGGVSFSSAAEALASINTNTFSQSNDTSLHSGHDGRTGNNSPDITMPASSGGYTFEFLQGSLPEWDTAWEASDGPPHPSWGVMYYKSPNNLKLTTASASTSTGSFQVRASSGSDSGTITVNWSQSPMVGTEVPAVVFTTQ
ncbi:MAG: type II secretion system protein [Tindallia sp. MSAO_Bac2]|nr:MAG: type II secretion system protein [Tindallia sp. MSAO_Bac2]